MSPPKVLVVDDDAESRGLICEVLEANGYTVGAAVDGLAAREALNRDHDYRIVIADLRMPNEDGMDLLRNLRQQKAQHDVILMSSFMSGAEKKVAQDMGVRKLLEKPFRLSDLLQMVGELAGRNPIEAGATP